MSPAGSDHGRPPGDPIEDYLDQLYAGLRTTPRQARRIIAEAEDHLHEATAAGTEAGLSEPEAQEAAISSFGSVRTVVRAHARRIPPRAVCGELAMAAWQLTSIAVLAVAGSGLVALVMNQVLGPQFVGGEPALANRGTGMGLCQYWLGIWTHAQNCGQAAMLETSSDAVSLRLLVLIPGLVLLAGYLLARRYQRSRGWRADLLPDAFVPTVAACLFGGLTASLAFLGLAFPMPLTPNGGPGVYLSAAIATLLVTIGFVPALRRALLRHAYG
ncbi:MAG TPA: permease prefix domain 1-containing protein [Streptosporangiaceae bacterium]